MSQSYQVKNELKKPKAPEIKLWENKSRLNINHFIILKMTDS